MSLKLDAPRGCDKDTSFKALAWLPARHDWRISVICELGLANRRGHPASGPHPADATPSPRCGRVNPSGWNRGWKGQKPAKLRRWKGWKGCAYPSHVCGRACAPVRARRNIPNNPSNPSKLPKAIKSQCWKCPEICRFCAYQKQKARSL